MINCNLHDLDLEDNDNVSNVAVVSTIIDTETIIGYVYTIHEAHSLKQLYLD